MARRKTHKEFIAEMLEKQPDIEVLGQYVKSDVKIDVKCEICGHEWSIIPNHLLHGHGCPKCRMLRCVEKQRKTHEEFIAEMLEKQPDIEVLGRYLKNKVKVEVKCKVCGYEWQTVPSGLLSGRGCPKCANVRRVEKQRKTHEEFIAEMSEKHPDIEILGHYVNTHVKITVRCKVCGYEWSVMPSSLSVGSSCLRCSGSMKKTHEEFVLEMAEKQPNIEVLGCYVSAHVKVDVKCKICNNVWCAKPSGLLWGAGCSNCAKSGTSYVEQVILHSFVYVFGEDSVLSRERDAIGKELDIYIPSAKFAIEYGSWCWHKKRILDDVDKQITCENHGIRLITIYDAMSDADIMVFGGFMWCYSEFLGHVSSDNVLLNLIYDLFYQVDVSIRFSDDEWGDIKNSAYRSSRRMTTDELKEVVNKVLPTVEILGEYHGYNMPIRCCCECGYVWNSKPNYLIGGHGCPKCGIVRRAEKRQRSVRCVETGTVYKSLKEAAFAMSLKTSGSICTAAKKGIKACGYHWEYCDLDE